MAGEIIHVEFPSADFGKSSEFYQALFGWRPDGEQAGGHLAVNVPGGGVQSSWVRAALTYAPGPVVFVAVDDVVATLAEATRMGGRVLVPKLNLMNKGSFALLADPDGNVVAVTSTLSDGDSGAASGAPPMSSTKPALAGTAPSKSTPTLPTTTAASTKLPKAKVTSRSPIKAAKIKK